MTSRIIGIGDCKVSADPKDVLVTHALGSCVGVVVYDPMARVAGLLHYMLPESSLDPAKAKSKPFLFADTGIPELFHRVYGLGAVKSRLIVIAAGGAQMLDPNGTFHIGKRNQLAMRKIFWKAGVMICKEEVGGDASRTIRIEVGTGKVLLRTSGGVEREMTTQASPKGVHSGL